MLGMKPNSLGFKTIKFRRVFDSHFHWGGYTGGTWAWVCNSITSIRRTWDLARPFGVQSVILQDRTHLRWFRRYIEFHILRITLLWPCPRMDEVLEFVPLTFWNIMSWRTISATSLRRHECTVVTWLPTDRQRSGSNQREWTHSGEIPRCRGIG